MIRPGEIYRLKVAKILSFGVYLTDEEDVDRILLPRKQLPPNTRYGDELEVFIYLDSSDRPIATVRRPAVTLGKLAVLKVKDTSRIGAFLDWGLEKDLFLPFKEQTYKARKGEDVLAALYTDKSGRLCATMRIYDYLSARPPYAAGDEVTARIFDKNPKYGLFAAVEDRYSAMIPNKDIQGGIDVGDVITARITEVREDGRLNLSPRKKAYQQIGPDAELVLEKIREYNGVLPFDDHADPERIKAEFGFSKAAFKRAVGHLYKERLVELKDGKIIGK